MKKRIMSLLLQNMNPENSYEDQSALEACQLLFLDINMQGMDGLKTAMRIKEKYPKLPVVLVTAYMNPPHDPSDNTSILSFFQKNIDVSYRQLYFLFSVLPP